MVKGNFLLCYIVAFMLCLFPEASPSNILVVAPAVSKSHFNVGEAITIGLANAGHNVTIISPFDYKPKSANIEAIQTVGLLEKAEEMQKQYESQGLDSFQKMPMPVILPILFYFGSDLCHDTLTNPNIQALFDRKYDLVIVEIFGSESLIGLGQKFNAPVIGFSTFSTSRWTNDLSGNPSPLSYISHTMLDLPDKMTFWHRAYNTVMYVYESLLLHALHHPMQRRVYNKAFPDAKISYDEALKSISLFFVNSHFSIARPLPYLPNTIEVGGMHVNRKTKPLPDDIKAFIESAKDGVIYFSLGSFMKSANFPVEKRDAFIETFSKMKQKIIWKFEDETVPMPKNVYRGSWLPQSDILGHPNVIAFISHGGLLGSTEAVYHGVPIVGIPFFGDQRLNVKRASQAGWAIPLPYENITQESVERTLNEILTNKTYLENAKIISQRYRDQPMTPSETMVYWAEYVIRHKGAPHLRNSGLDLNFFQYHNVDVLIALAVLNILFFYVLKVVICKLCCRKRKALPSQQKPNKKKTQ